MYYKGEKLDAPHVQDTDFHGYGASIKERLSAIIPADEDLRVLDVGTGMASNVRFLLEHMSKRSEVWTLDPSEEMLSRAKEKVGAEDRRRVRFVKGTADALEFEDKSFDLVVSVMVAHHMEKVDESIAEMARVLKRGGRVIIVDYSPEAHVLEFHSRHAEKDFVKPGAITRAMKKAHLKRRVENYDMWYLIEGSRE